MIDFGPWRPDLPALDAPGLTDVVGAVPDVASWEPQPGLVPFTGPMDNRCIGAFSAIGRDGASYWFAGTRFNLYTINAQTSSWSNVSRPMLPFIPLSGFEEETAVWTVPVAAPATHRQPVVFGSQTRVKLTGNGIFDGIEQITTFGGVTITVPQDTVSGGHVRFGLSGILTTPLAYHVDSIGRWSFVQYGETVYAADYVDPIQFYVLGAAQRFGDAPGDPPKCRYLASVKNFLVAVGTDDPIDGPRPQRVRWSGIDAPESWTPSATTQADFQDLLGDGGWNQGIVPGLAGADAVVFQERAVWRMTYVGTPFVFQFDQVEGVRGTPAPGSICQVGGFVYYYGEDGFYEFDGATSRPIGQGKINRTFFSDLNNLGHHRIWSAADINKKLVFWSYPSGTSDGCNKIIVFNWTTEEWGLLSVSTEVLLRTLSIGYTLEDLNKISPSIDLLPVSLDSRQWVGGVMQLSAFDERHQLAHFSGPAMSAELITKEIRLSEMRRGQVTQVWPLVDLSGSQTPATVSIGHRTRPGDNTTYSVAGAMNSVGFCPQRVNDNFMRFKVSLPQGWAKAQGVDVRSTEVGWR